MEQNPEVVNVREPGDLGYIYVDRGDYSSTARFCFRGMSTTAESRCVIPVLVELGVAASKVFESAPNNIDARQT